MMKQMIQKYLALSLILMFTVLLGYAYAVDTTSHTFVSQSSSGLGSNNSVVSTENYPRPSGSGAYYINKGNNSSIIGNYFEGYYYDSMLGYFEFDWSANDSENVRITGSTPACTTGYGYKLGGYSWNPSFGYMDFDFNDDTFVYYCVSDGELHGFAYNSFLGFQNFEGIAFDIDVSSGGVGDVITPNDEFVNDDTTLIETNLGSSSTSSGGGQGTAKNSNFTDNSIQNEINSFDTKVESLFYIIK